MSLLDQLQPIIQPEPVPFWPPAPGWWVLLALVPLLGYGLWRARVLLPKKAARENAEQPLDPLRQAALIELAQLPGPGCNRSTGCSSGFAAIITRTARATHSMAANGWRFWTIAVLQRA